MYRIETHMHTKESSACAESAAEEMIIKYKSLGYNGVIITDHFLNGNTTVDKNLSWSEQIDLFCIGYENAKDAGKRYDVDVFFGLEFTHSGTDLLTYGIDKQWLKAHPEIIKIPVPEYIKLVKQNGGMVIQTHPFRDAWYINTIRLYSKFVDGLEVRNTARIK